MKQQLRTPRCSLNETSTVLARVHIIKLSGEPLQRVQCDWASVTLSEGWLPSVKVWSVITRRTVCTGFINSQLASMSGAQSVYVRGKKKPRLDQKSENRSLSTQVKFDLKPSELWIKRSLSFNTNILWWTAPLPNTVSHSVVHLSE